MKKIIILMLAALSVAMLMTSCVERPVKKSKNANASINTQNSSESEETIVEEALQAEETQDPVSSEPEIIDGYIYTGDEINDELIEKILIGYWEFDDFGYSGGYNFFESGFLQLILEHEVNQTGIFMVRNNGIYFSLDSKNWDEDVLIVQTISNTEITGAFGDNVLVLHRSDPSLIKENSGIYLEDTSSGSSIIDVGNEANSGVSAS